MNIKAICDIIYADRPEYHIDLRDRLQEDGSLAPRHDWTLTEGRDAVPTGLMCPACSEKAMEQDGNRYFIQRVDPIEKCVSCGITKAEQKTN